MFSIILLAVANRWQDKLNRFEEYLLRAISPIQYSIDMPMQMMEQGKRFFGERKNILAENDNLQQSQMQLQAEVQKLQAVIAENQELRQLLKTVGKEKDSFAEARLIHVNADPFSQQIVLNKGKNNGIEIGQAVIDSQGLVGVVLALNDNTSRVLLLTDKGFAVPVQSLRSGERAIATGSGIGNELRLNYVPRTADFVEGDELVTSGIGGKFPAGFPVGTITSIQHDPGTRFTLIGVKPNAKLAQLRHVLFVKRDYIPGPDSTVALALKSEEKPVIPLMASIENPSESKIKAPQVLAKMDDDEEPFPEEYSGDE